MITEPIAAGEREMMEVPGALGLSDSEDEFEDTPFAQAVSAADWKALQV